MKIAIITGGETGERDVSIRSAKNVSETIGFAEVETFVFPEERERFISHSNEFDLAIPIIHGKGGEDGSLQGLFKHLCIPFIFSEITTHSIAIDKGFTKEIVSTLGIVSPENTTTFPCFAKPLHGGSSVSSMLCNSKEEFQKLMSDNAGTIFITEKPIKGREFTVGIIEHNNETNALPVVEIIPTGLFFDFENKYDPKKLAQEICPAVIDDVLMLELQRQALLIHRHLNVRHISRSDFIVTQEGTIYFLEINTIPGMTVTSIIPKMLEVAGLSFENLVKEWCEDQI